MEKTGTELMMKHYAGTRLDAMVAPVMSIADDYAYEARQRSPDERAARMRLERAIRDAICEAVAGLARAPQLLRTEND